MKTPPSHAGFSLLEILIAVSIVLILATLAQPAAMYLLEGARSQKCANNLRQMHQGYISYIADNNGNMTNYRSWTVDPVTGKDVAGPFWREKITPYLGSAKPTIFTCPAERKDVTPMYGMNSNIAIEPFANNRYPAQRFLFADSNGTTRITTGAAGEEGSFRHSGETKLNIVFLDGHIESLSFAEFPTSMHTDKKSPHYRAFWLGVD